MSEPTTEHAISQPDPLATGLAARLLHDLSGPAEAILSGLQLLEDPGAEALKGEALGLAADGARRLIGMLTFCRAAYGGGATATDGEALGRLARAPFEARRPSLEWTLSGETLSATAVQAMLILTQIAADALAVGGVARAGAGTAAGVTTLWIDGEGPRARFLPETLDGLAGRPASEGLTGRWAPPFHMRVNVVRAGGSVSLVQRPGGFRLEVRLPRSRGE
jgi:histidine phosphotransferase ChpT